MSAAAEMLLARATLLKGSAASFSIKSGGAVAALVLQVILARVLGIAEYGVYTYLITWVTLIAMIAPLGSDKAALRFIPIYLAKSQPGVLTAFSSWGLRISSVGGAGLAIAFAVVMSSGILSGVVAASATAVVAAAMLIPVFALTQYLSEVVRSFRRVVQAEAPIFVFRPVMLMAALGLWWVLSEKGPSAGQALVLTLVAGSLTLALLAVFSARLAFSVSREPVPTVESKAWLKGALPFVVVVSSNLILTRTDILMIGWISGTTEAGTYNAAARVATAVGFPLIAIASILTPLMSQMYAARKSHQLQEILRLGVRLSVFVTWSVGIIGVAMAEQILALFGPEFTGAAIVMRILIGGLMVTSMMGAVGYLLAVTGGQNTLAVMTGIAALANVALNAALIPRYGSVGAALATAIVLFTYNLVLAATAIRTTGVNPTLIGWRGAGRST